MIVFEFPPKAFYKILVKADSQYGTTFPSPFPTALSANVLMTFPRVDKERLIAQPSLSLSFVAFVFFYRSEPAKSTRLITENLSVLFPSTTLY